MYPEVALINSSLTQIFFQSLSYYWYKVISSNIVSNSIKESYLPMSLTKNTVEIDAQNVWMSQMSVNHAIPKKSPNIHSLLSKALLVVIVVEV